MPRSGRTGAQKQESKMADSETSAGWLPGDGANQKLRKICGFWRDQMGSKYNLQLDDTGTMIVKTTRPRGKTMRTRGLIRIEWEDNHGRVVWGREGAQVLFTISKLDSTSLTWRSNQSKSFHWFRPETWNEDGPLETGEYDGDFWDENLSAWQRTGDWQEDWYDWDDEEDWHDSPEDAVKRRQQLRRQLQEKRQQVRKQVGPKKQTGNYGDRSQKGMASKKDVPTVPRKEIDHCFSSTSTFTDAKAKSDTLKSMLKIHGHMAEDTDPADEQETQHESRGTKGSKHEVRTDGLTLLPPPAEIVGMTSTSCGSTIILGDSDAAKHSPPQSKSTQDTGHPQAGQEAKQSCDVGERLLSELCTGISTRNEAATDASQQRNIGEQSTQGLPGQTWITPPWTLSVGPSLNPPDLQSVMSTLEWHFSYANLSSDLYLRSLMMPGEGWVPLMVLLAFPRMAILGTDCATLGQAASCSSTLELDSTGYYTRIRDQAWRAHWLPTRPSQG
mmetsp:Transcript_20653/g.40358  ORF Transcript_20653/g.40358 Transcript_20653/m.40358 type:complete len:500 (+) Transcript_20653:100-1599(+)